MKVVGLLSGGKDSCYNLVHCVQQGHEVVALATLAPPGSKDELDSYMYQTVGHDAVHLVAEAMRLPLYRRVIHGTAVNQRSEYGSRSASSSTNAANTHAPASTPDDETEDLYHLLLDVKSHRPDVEAVSVGAILSNYQRVRVEHVALRPDINLTPLTFLWQRSQSELYAEMLDAGLVSILIKVAGIGLDERDLGKTLGQMQAKLERLSALYGAHVCGEGGEYETLTIDSPLFYSRIDVAQTETVVHSESGFGSVSYLRLKNARLMEKEGEEQRRETRRRAKTPDLLDAVGTRTLKAAQDAKASMRTEGLDQKMQSLAISTEPLHLPPPSIRQHGRYRVLSNIVGTTTTTSSSTQPVAVEDQVKNAFSTLLYLLSSSSSPSGLGMEHITHINLYLRSQTLFSRINAVYRSLFGVSPPTRACVALPALPPGCDLVVQAIAFDDRGETCFERRALHVQGRSFWAPANIGPYSQSLVQAEKVWVAGQIGLVPADLTLPDAEGKQALQTALSIQHARRILKATLNDMGGRSVAKGWVEGGVCWVNGSEMVEVARCAWMGQFDDEECGEVDDEEEKEENWIGQTRSEKGVLPPMLFVTLPTDALPRSASIEWQLTAHTGRIPPSLNSPTNAASVPTETYETLDNHDSDQEDDNEPGADAADVQIIHTSSILPITTTTNSAAIQASHTVTCSTSAKAKFGILSLRSHVSQDNPNHSQDECDAFAASIQSIPTSAYAMQLFRPAGDHREALDLLNRLLTASGANGAALIDEMQHIPCHDLHIVDPQTPAQQVQLAVVWHGI